jgi:hypothetical protein
MPQNRAISITFGIAAAASRQNRRHTSLIVWQSSSRAQDKDLHHRGRAELPLCPEFLGGAAASSFPEK